MAKATRKACVGARLLGLFAILLALGGCEGPWFMPVPPATAPAVSTPATTPLALLPSPTATATPSATMTAPAPLLVPTRVSQGTAARAASGATQLPARTASRVTAAPQPAASTPQVTRTGLPAAVATAATAQPDGSPARPASSLRARVGVGVPLGPVDAYDWQGSEPGWYLNWRVETRPARPGGAVFAQMVRLRPTGFYPSADVISATARLQPGSLWLIGNEPDVVEQDNVTPERYVEDYRTLYRLIKTADATAQIAIGGVAQPTPLRMAYLDRILAGYRQRYGEDMPVDAWNVHGFILREQRGSWGVGIPLGMQADEGKLYEVEDHARLDIFKQQIMDFRRWMLARGLRDKPLIVSEYGILMPEDYGFGADVVAQFMKGSFDFLLNATDPALGYPQDENRLVQAFCWYSASDTMFPTSNLFDPQTRAVTPLGAVFRDYVAALK